ncbi:MAG: AAA family ATPase [Burkholderiales bacterium]|nr:AAA family ATPase [Burkholderiales bacterium]
MKWLDRLIRKTTPPEDVPKVEDTASADPDTEAKDPYSSDEPITSKTQDRFGRAPFAARIAQTIAHRADPSSIVIGLFGPWGDGKTSVLKMMEEALDQHEHVITIRFNPWHFPSEDALLRGFFSTLSQALGEEPALKEKVAALLETYGGVLSLISVSLPGVDLNPGEAAKNMGESLSRVSLDQLKEKIDALLGHSGKRLVILIDDIDRLDRDETHAIFKLVKLSASFRRTCYVLAFDDSVVAAALGERYGAGGDEAGRAFLEKIIQVPLHLPPVDRISLRQLAFEGVEQALGQAGITLEKQQVDIFMRHFVDGLEPKLETPRVAKLYANSLMFALPLVKGEVNIAEFMLVEGLRVLYPKLYAAIRDNPDLFLKGEGERRVRNLEPPPSRINDLLVDAMPGSTSNEREVVRERLIKGLFPRTGNMNYGGEWDEIWASTQRICSGRYFRRYFVYGVPEGDISDTEVATLIVALSTGAVADQDARLARYPKRAIPQLIQVLRERADQLDVQAALPLALAVARNGGQLPRERGAFVLGGTRMQAGFLLAQLMRRIPQADRQAAVESVVQSAQPLSFAMECSRWLTHSHDRTEEYVVLPEAGDPPIYALLADRVRTANNGSPIFQQFGTDAPGLYWLWLKADGKEGVEPHLRQAFDARPEALDEFLDTYVGEGWEMESGLPVRSDLRRESYDQIASLITPEYLIANLRARYGAEMDNPQYRADGPMARKIAHQFAYIHKAANQAGEPEDADAES